MILSQEEKNKLLNERIELKKKLKEISKILNCNGSSEFMKNEKNKYHCDICDVSFNKYFMDNHTRTKNHIINKKIYDDNIIKNNNNNDDNDINNKKDDII